MGVPGKGALKVGSIVDVVEGGKRRRETTRFDKSSEGDGWRRLFCVPQPATARLNVYSAGMYSWI